MKQSELNLQRASLEKMYRLAAPETSRTLPLIKVFAKIWHQLIPLFEKKQALIVRQQSDRVGKVFWTAYDPVTGRSQAFGSPTELLVWLEQNSG